MSENLNALEKAQVLIEALPYIQRFNRKIIVVKYGGSAMVDEKLKKQVIQDVTLLKLGILQLQDGRCAGHHGVYRLRSVHRCVLPLYQ